MYSMLIFLKLIYSASNNMDNTTSIEEINEVKTDVKELINEFFSVEKDFEIMENHFNEKLNTLIDEKKNNLNPLYFEYFQKKEKETESVEHIPRALSDVYCHFLEQILPGIVFDDFLLFYDEYSYVMNKRIIKMYEKFGRIKNTLADFPEFGTMNFKNDIDNVSLEDVKYRDFYYFYNKLEQKLVLNFDVDLYKIRNILYGCNPNDVEFKQLKQIQEHFRFILLYKRKSSPGNEELYNIVKPYSIEENPSSQEENNKVSMIRYIHHFDKHLPHLYKYRETIPKIFTLSKTRFSIYEKFLKQYKQFEYFPPKLDEKNTALFPNYYGLPPNDTEIALRRVIFEYVSYTYEVYNEYSLNLNEIKQVLQRLL